MSQHRKEKPVKPTPARRSSRLRRRRNWTKGIKFNGSLAHLC